MKKDSFYTYLDNRRAHYKCFGRPDFTVEQLLMLGVALLGGGAWGMENVALSLGMLWPSVTE